MVSTERPDEITTGTAAALLGVSPRRIRQLAEERFITIHRRGHTTVVSAVQGYLRSVKADASRAPLDTSMSRSHTAKAQLTEASTARRRAVLTERTEAEQTVQIVAETAATRLRSITIPASLSPAIAKALQAEIAATCTKIEEAQKTAMQAIATGNVSLVEGGGHGAP